MFERGVLPPDEGLLFSDIRMHFGLALRAKNAHLYIRDLLEELVPIDAVQLSALSNSKAILKIRYVCDPPAKDHRHIKALPKIALAVAELSGSDLIYDLYQRRTFGREQLELMLQPRMDPGRADVHVSTVWLDTIEPRTETRGLRKKGLPELSTQSMEADEKNLVMYLVGEAAHAIWEAGMLPEKLTFDYFDNPFEITFEASKPGDPTVRVHLLRGST